MPRPAASPPRGGGAPSLALYVLLVQLLAVLWFTQGFFLTRYALPLSTAACPALRAPGPPPTATAGTLPPAASCCRAPHYRRAVLIVIDALRDDFTFHQPHPPTAPLAYQNRLPILHHTLRTSPRSSYLYSFAADPPTTTAQRIKGLTGGGMPTFLDAMDNFDPAVSVTDDSWLAQLQRANRSIVFMGDDTWTSLFPTAFTKAYAYPSLVVKDLHTVDNGVLQHLLPTMQGSGEWDLILAHFLGVDHVGHTHGSLHPAMSEKLEQMNAMLTEVIAAIEEDTLLIVLGDHGMTTDGNHGGASRDEVAAGLFLYSKTPFLDSPSHFAQEEVLSAESVRSVPQIDLVPTLSLVLGLPIPFGNLGSLIPELFTRHDMHPLGLSTPISGDTSPAHSIQAREAIACASSQLHTYLHEYNEHSGQFAGEAITSIRALYARVSQLAQASGSAALTQLYAEYGEFARTVLDLCRAKWTQFDLARIASGALLLLAVTLLLFGVVAAYSLAEVAEVSALLSSLGLWWHIAAIASLTVVAAISPVPPLLVCVIALCSVGLLLLPLTRLAGSVAVPPSAETLVTGSLLLLRVASLNSNSFIEAEATTFRYALVTLTGYWCYRCCSGAGVRNLLTRAQCLALCSFPLSVALLSGFSNQSTRGGSEGDAVALLLITALPIALALTAHWRPRSIAVLVGASVALLVTEWLRHPASVLLSTTLTLTVWPLAVEHMLRLQKCRLLPLARVLWYAAFALLEVYWLAVRYDWVQSLHSASVLAWAFRIATPNVLFCLSLLMSLLAVVPLRPTPRASEEFQPLARRHQLLLAALPSLLLVLGWSNATALNVVALLVLAAAVPSPAAVPHVSRSPLGGQSGVVGALALGYALFLVASLLFYATGHSPQFSSLQFDLAYIGADHYHFLRSLLLVLTNTFAPVLVCPLLVYALPLTPSPVLVLFSYSLAFTVSATTTALFTGAMRRHLMVWRLFAPKYLFDTVFMLLAQVAVVALLSRFPAAPLTPHQVEKSAL